MAKNITSCNHKWIYVQRYRGREGFNVSSIEKANDVWFIEVDYNSIFDEKDGTMDEYLICDVCDEHFKGGFEII